VAFRQRGWSGRTDVTSNMFWFLSILFLLYPSACAKPTGGPILTIYTPCHVFLRKEVPLGGRVETAPHFGGNIPKNLHFDSMNRHFQA